MQLYVYVVRVLIAVLQEISWLPVSFLLCIIYHWLYTLETAQEAKGIGFQLSK